MVKLSEGMKVDVYRNLHKNKLSVRHKSKVIAHVDSITLQDVQFVVSEVGRNRVLREKRKNVHAFVRGFIASPVVASGTRTVKYNPYISCYFHDVETNEPIKQVEQATVTVEGVTV